MPVVVLSAAFMSTGLVCPPGLKRVEYCDKEVPGLLVEVRSSKDAVPTWYVRYKNEGRTRYERIGDVRGVSLQSARKATIAFKAQRKAAPSEGCVAPVKALPMTLDRFVAEEVNPHNRVRKRSHARDLQLYKRIGPRFGHLSLMDIRRKDVQAFHNALVTEERLSPASADHHVTYMRRILNLAVQWEFIEKNVLTKIPLMKVDNKVERYLTEEETSRLIEVLQRDKAGGASNIFLFLLSTGARLNEAMSAKWEQMDLASEIWRVPASNSKSKRSRVVPLNESAVWVLNQLDTKGHHDFLFVNPATNRPFVTITRAWYRLRRKAGIESMRIHDLRHSYASFLANANCSLYEIQNILGHSDPRVTQRYAHLQHQTLKNAARAGSMIVRSKGTSAVA